jgi:thiamine biosynthesis lipoprotein
MAFTPKVRGYLVVFLIIGWVASLGYFAFSSRKQNHPLKKTSRLYRDNRLLMGTFWEIVSTDKRAGAIVFAEARRIENLLSKYLPDSEVSRLNRAGKLKVSPDTFYIIKKSKEFWQVTGGAFDITIAPLVDLWGFTSRQHNLPGENSIKAALELVGSDKIILHEKDNMVEFKLPGMKIDLGAIAKGFAVDCAVKLLKDNNIDNCLINAGGQVYALGEGPKGKWKVAVQNPRKPGISRPLELKDQSASTSGDYEQFFLKDGKRYCHIINPKTGQAINSGIVSVTIVDRSGLNADALSTAVFILGEEGLKMLKNKFPETRFYIKQGKGL